MGTSIRPEITKRSKYWIGKNRYYELKHFCLQYSEFISKFKSLDGYSKKTEPDNPNDKNFSRSVEKAVVKRDIYKKKIDSIEKSAELIDDNLGKYILMAVTDGLSYSNLKTKHNIPCGKDMYYELYRKFFWTLDKTLEELYF